MNAKTIARIAILIAVLSVIGGASLYIQRVRVARTASDELKRADDAEKRGDFSTAEELYRLHLKVFPDDVDAQLNYAKAISKGDDSLERRERASQIYRNVLTRTRRDDVLRLLMDLKIKSNHFVSRGPQDEGADADVKILLGHKEFEQDGDLWFWLGRCQEEGGQPKEAADSYQNAIKYKAPKRIEAIRRCAELLRGEKLDQPEQAERLINKMVEADPKNYQVHLERGRYRVSKAAEQTTKAAQTNDPSSRKSLELQAKCEIKEARSDFEKAKNLAQGEAAEPYLELAKIDQQELHIDQAKRTLEEGLLKIPTSKLLYEQLANLLAHTHKYSEAIETLELGLSRLKSTTDQTELRILLADFLALEENTGELLLQIEELKRAGFSPILAQYFNARYYMTMNNFVKARELLTSIQPVVIRDSRLVRLNVRINLLLARCYGHLGEPEKQRAANRLAHTADPLDLEAHLVWIADMVNSGDTDGAIKECRTIVDRAPQARLRLAHLLIARNSRRPESERDWSEIERLISDAERAAPESYEPIALRAEYLVARGTPVLARQELERARARFPKSVEPWIAQADLMGYQGQLSEALKLLDQAERELGARVDLRLTRARLWTLKKGPEAAEALRDLAQDVEVFPNPDDRYKLLNGLALELVRQQDYDEAIRLWSQLSDQNPKDMELRLRLLQLEFELPRTDDTENFIKRKAEIEICVRQIEEIEGSDGSMGRYWRARFLIWQAVQRATESSLRAEQRAQARLILNDLMVTRADWALIPLALAQLEEQELAEQSRLTDEERQAKEKHIVELYLQAIPLGHCPPPILIRAVGLLIKSHRGSEARNLLNRTVHAAETKAWARRTLASVLASGTKKERQDALLYFELNNQPAAIGQEGKTLDDPEDLRVLAQVLEMQKTALQRNRAIEILESLSVQNLASAEDRFRLAQLCELSGDWPKAREKYRDLCSRTKVLPNHETLERRPYYLAVFAESLLRHRQSGDEQTLADAQELVNEIKQLQPKSLTALPIQLKLYQARNQLDEAAKLIRAVPNQSPQVLEALASEAEKLGLLALAKELYTRRSVLPDVLQGKLLLAAFFGRRGDAKRALDICEPLWANTRDINVVAPWCIDVLFGDNSTHSPNPEQLKRVGEWLERALAQPQTDPSTTSSLYGLLGSLRDQQGDYQNASEQYRRGIKHGDRGGIIHNNLAWLTALNDHKPTEALDDVNSALALKPEHPDFLDTRGVIHLIRRDVPNAIEDLTRAVEIDPSPNRLFHLAQAYLAANDKQKAKECLARAKTKGFAPGGLHALERPACESVLRELEAS